MDFIMAVGLCPLMPQLAGFSKAPSRAFYGFVGALKIIVLEDLRADQLAFTRRAR
jgi:hypothetical protein